MSCQTQFGDIIGFAQRRRFLAEEMHHATVRLAGELAGDDHAYRIDNYASRGTGLTADASGAVRALCTIEAARAKHQLAAGGAASRDWGAGAGHPGSGPASPSRSLTTSDVPVS